MQGYVERQLGAMSGQIAEDRAASAKMAAETAAMKAETHELQTKVRKCRKANAEKQMQKSPFPVVSSSRRA